MLLRRALRWRSLLPSVPVGAEAAFSQIVWARSGICYICSKAEKTSEAQSLLNPRAQNCKHRIPSRVTAPSREMLRGWLSNHWFPLRDLVCRAPLNRIA
jgi:hypothetical protein